MQELNFLNDTFNYQVKLILSFCFPRHRHLSIYNSGSIFKIDIIVPNSEKIFDRIRTDLFDEHRYYLLKNISLSKLLSLEFVNKFIKNGNEKKTPK